MKLLIDKKFDLVLLSFAAGLLVAGIAFAAYVFFSGPIDDPTNTLLNHKKGAATTNEVLAQAQEDLKATDDLDTTEVDQAVNDINSIDLSGI
jgi:hypothetical protein